MLQSVLFTLAFPVDTASFKKPRPVLHEDIAPSVEVGLSDSIGIAKGGYSSMVASQALHHNLELLLGCSFFSWFAHRGLLEMPT